MLARALARKLGGASATCAPLIRGSSDSAAIRPALPEDGLTLSHFIAQRRGSTEQLVDAPASTSGRQSARSVFIETYGCAMNTSDSEVVLSVLGQAGFGAASSADAADIVLINTCAIRENAEAKIWQRLGYFKNVKAQRRRGQRGAANAPAGPVVGVLGCMAERLKHKLLESEKLVDLVAGPDAYRDLPRLIDIVQGAQPAATDETPSASASTSTSTSASAAAAFGRRTAINVQLSADETYADVVPVRPAGTRSAFLSIMRGCNNMCSFCIVPHTRGRERSRPLSSIIDEVRMLSEQGVKEVMLLGQNVNSYADFSHPAPGAPSHGGGPAPEERGAAFAAHYARGFRSVYAPRRAGAARFADLLHAVAAVDGELRVRFTSPHPKDFSDDVLDAVAAHPNVCTQLHMPAQSGSSSVLERMRRGYTREAYDELVAHVRRRLPGVALSTDMIAGFCGESEAEHAASVELLRATGFDAAFLFAYSERERTHAARHLADDVPAGVKSRRLEELIRVYREGLHAHSAAEVGRRHLVLVEGRSKRSGAALTGRTDTFKRVVFPDDPLPPRYAWPTSPGGDPGFDRGQMVHAQPGDYVAVEVTGATGGTLFARPLGRTTLREFVQAHGSALPLELFGGGGGGAEERAGQVSMASV